MSAATIDVASASVRARVSLLTDALRQRRRLFDNVGLTTFDDVLSLRDLTAKAGVTKLHALFADAGLEPSFAFNPGTQLVSCVAAVGPDEPLPAPGDDSDVTARRALIWTMLALWSDQAAVEAHYERETRHRAGQLEGLASDGNDGGDDDPDHDAAEVLANRCLAVFAAQTGVGMTGLLVYGGQEQPAVGVAGAAASPPPPRRIRIVIEPCQRGLREALDRRYLCSDAGTALYRLSRHYYLFWGPVSSAAEARWQLAQRMVRRFWRVAAGAPFSYVPDKTLLADVSGRLLRFFYYGSRAAEEGFYCGHEQVRAVTAPPASVAAADAFGPAPAQWADLFLGWYLHGPAGTGKTSFVAMLAAALRTVMREHVDPRFGVDIVKLPLNAVTGVDLSQTLSIKGLSDWSVERVMEQTLCKGHLVVFHLEEVPLDVGLQQRLFAHVARMLEGLYRRYPEFKAHVIYVFSSNYAPTLGVDAAAAAAAPRDVPAQTRLLDRMCRVVHMQCPSSDERRRWCRRALLNNTAGFVQPRLLGPRGGRDTVDGLGREAGELAASDDDDDDDGGDDGGFVVLRVPARATAVPSAAAVVVVQLRFEICAASVPLPDGGGDMRTLSMWCAVLAYHLGHRLLTAWLPHVVSEAARRPAQEQAGGEGPAERVVAVTVRLSGAASKSSGPVAAAAHTLAVSLLCPAQSAPVVADLVMLSRDGVFYHPAAAALRSSRRPDERAPPSSVFSPAAVLPVSAMLDMWRDAFLTPVVLVLAPPRTAADAVGDEARFGACLSSLRLLAQAELVAAAGHAIAEHSVVLRSEEDRTLLSGEARDIRGGLYKFIDDINNPAAVSEGAESKRQQEAAVGTVKRERPDPAASAASDEGDAGDAGAHANGQRQKRRRVAGGAAATDAAVAGAPPPKHTYAFVIARVNDVGQFMLRDLLEIGTARTHRLTVRKERVLFLVCVDRGSRIQPQLRSRAHYIIDE